VRTEEMERVRIWSEARVPADAAVGRSPVAAGVALARAVEERGGVGTGALWLGRRDLGPEMRRDD